MARSRKESLENSAMVWVLGLEAIVFMNLLVILAIGFTLTYMTARIPNFSHGTLAVIGVYVTFHLHRVMDFNPYVGIPVAFVLVGTLLYVLYLTVVRTLRRMGATVIALTVSTIALEILLFAILNIYVEVINDITGELSRFFIFRTIDFVVLGLPGIMFVSTLLSIILILGLHYLLTQTKFGISLRATVENPELAEIMGINTERIIGLSWFLTGGFAGLAGSILPMWLAANPVLGFQLLISVFAASILGGIRSIYGAVLGGVIVGLAEIFGTVVIGTLLGPWVAAYRLIIPLTLMSVILLIFPEGLSGLIEDYRSKRVARELEQPEPISS